MVATINFPVVHILDTICGVLTVNTKKEIEIKKNAEKVYGYYSQIKGYTL